ncbi:hypothetical protein SAMN05444678_11860 [Sphingomonas sp. YR710]|jgi:hypothetical protein|uniref:hypothetical protein n=1 Tax=Sphingomonas sp. YR710 TaxID=1882773 RepID=UPI000883EFBB|nr:hypothetical protein [Sphingomonas sp. YR710]SDD66176.1 hypothetical protein SAMN05444678_11860 [Sphingomonas sp. YR710]
MSRLWDTPEFWARSEADEMLRDFPATDVAALADSMEKLPDSYDGDPQFTLNLVTELRHRAVAGVRFWPEYDGLDRIEREVRAAVAGSATTALRADADDSDPEEAEVATQWWQRW